MKKVIFFIALLFLLYGPCASGQGLHFSQYYNAPLLLNPANTALLPVSDFQAGMNYRNQWATVPVPYNTFSAFIDGKVGGNRDNENHNNWLGVGLVFFSDKAGDGNLALSQVQGDMAYHLQLSRFTMISLGLSGAFVQRSVNYDNLTFDTQWDGMTFNQHLSNGEKAGIIKTNYYKVGSGLNFAWFPNESIYVKLGGGLDNINKPTESFYKNGTNTLDMRPTGNLDVLVRTGNVLIVNPSVYYTTQSGASELVCGALFRVRMSGGGSTPSELILGAYDRIGDAAIGVAGIKIGSVQFTASYDMTMSALSPYNGSYGALEFSLIYEGPYHRNQGIKKTFMCPRFF